MSAKIIPFPQTPSCVLPVHPLPLVGDITRCELCGRYWFSIDRAWATLLEGNHPIFPLKDGLLIYVHKEDTAMRGCEGKL